MIKNKSPTRQKNILDDFSCPECTWPTDILLIEGEHYHCCPNCPWRSYKPVYVTRERRLLNRVEDIVWEMCKKQTLINAKTLIARLHKLRETL